MNERLQVVSEPQPSCESCSPHSCVTWSLAELWISVMSTPSALLRTKDLLFSSFLVRINSAPPRCAHLSSPFHQQLQSSLLTEASPQKQQDRSWISCRFHQPPSCNLRSKYLCNFSCVKWSVCDSSGFLCVFSRCQPPDSPESS